MAGRFIIVRNVPCHKCSQCGEVSYSGEVVARLEVIAFLMSNGGNFHFQGKIENENYRHYFLLEGYGLFSSVNPNK